MKETLTVQRQPISLPPSLDISRPFTLLYKGARGALLPRLFAQGLHEMMQTFPNCRLVGTDVCPPDELQSYMASTTDQQGHLLSDLPWAGFACYQQRVIGKTIKAGALPIKIDGVIVGLPTYLHLSAAVEAATQGLVVLVEKPLSMVHEVRAMQALGAKFPKLILATDFFLEHAVMSYLSQIRNIGRIHTINSFCLEPTDIANENRGWLMQPSLSGGGILIDCGSHTLAMQEAALMLLKLSLDRASVRRVLLGRYKGAPGGPDVETAALVTAKVGDITLNTYVGKAVRERYYGLVAKGQQGEAEFFTGTEMRGAYVRLSVEGNTKIKLLDGEGLGYHRTALNLVLAIFRNPPVGSLTLEDKLQACSVGIQTIGRAYDWHARHGHMVEYQLGDTLPGSEGLVPEIDEASPVLATKGIWGK